MTSPDRLSELSAVADGKETSPESMRTMLAEALELLAAEKEQSTAYLKRIISEHGATLHDDLVETARHTMRVKRQELAALHTGRVR